MRWPPSAVTSRRRHSIPSAPSTSSASRTIWTPCGSHSPTGTTSRTCATALPRAYSVPDTGAGTGAGLSWRLVEGDVFETLAEVMPRPDLVFYDLFSGRTHAEAWTLSSFRRLFEAFGARDAELFTYTASTAARVAMLGADWLARWERSGARYASDLPEAARGAFEEAIRRDEQFRGLRLGVERA